MSVVAARPRRERTPDRPGPGPLRDGHLRKLDLTVRRRVDSLLVGDHRATTLGDGTELAQVRPYVIGDDVRRIDWNVTARTGEPHVRAHVAERTVNTWLLLDTSASMTFGTADRRKWDVAEGVALAVGHVAARRGNRLAVATFGDPQPAVHPRPATAGAGCSALLHALRREPSGEPIGTTSFGEACDRAARLVRRRSLVVAVSDFRGPLDWRRSLLRLARAPRRRRRRDPRPARAGAAERRHGLARRPGDARAATGRHARRAHARALRRGAAAERTRARADVPLGRRRRTSSSRPPATGCATLVRFLQLEKVRR